MIKQQITGNETQLEEFSNSEDFTNIKVKNKEKLSALRKNVELRKRTKLERDKDDYTNNRVYNWFNPNYRYIKIYRRGQQHKQISTSSSSPLQGHQLMYLLLLF